MKVFLSWSGSESRQLAAIFKEWLPNVLQYIDPYMSAKDIALGERWGNSIADNLENSKFGLIFVTPSNINAPWINFEAGALSKAINSKVIPILYNADVMILNQGPLKQFQSAKKLDKENILSLIESINESMEVGSLDKERLQKAFDMWWPDLEKGIEGIVKEDSNGGNEAEREPSEKEMLNVIFSKLVEQEKTLIRNQGVYENSGHASIRQIIPQSVFKDLKSVYMTLSMCQQTAIGNGVFTDALSTSVDQGIDKLTRTMENLGEINIHNIK